MRLYRRIVGKQPIALTELLPTIRQLSAIEKRELIRSKQPHFSFSTA
ncbi:MAG: hypothetical protein QQW96_06720 [Tychonema bourrellyi B0820]|nr:hypothetical protein [Tychonema bourrellyi]MDQ2097322.1 hypothetical protein [Tychonema bourrellyi B0820]